MCVYNSVHGSNALPDRQQQHKEPTMTTMTTIANNTFAAACYDSNTVAELEAALRGPANE